MSDCYFVHKIDEKCSFICGWKGNEFDKSLAYPKWYFVKEFDIEINDKEKENA